MGSSIPLGRLFGINLHVNSTLLLLFAIFAYRGFESSGLQGALDEITFLVLLFLSIFLHELGHAGAAAAFGIKTVDVTLHFFGGYARFSQPLDRPRAEAVIAVAGPLTNLTIAAALYLLLRGAQDAQAPAFMQTNARLIADVMFANLFLGAFNMLPGFPLDGGLFVRALLSNWLARPTARFIVALLGVLVGLALAGIGFALSDVFMVILGLLLAYIAAMEAVAARRASGSS